MSGTSSVSADTIRQFRDYVCSPDTPSYTVAFAAWELGWSVGKANLAQKEIERRGLVRQIEPRLGPYAAVYAYDPPKATVVERRANGHTAFPELDASHREINVRRGEAVPHTGGAVGPSGKPGRDRKKQAKGFKVKRARQGT